MFKSANTAQIRIASALKRLINNAANESFNVYVPGEGYLGCYATMEQAETARNHLPWSMKQKAMIHDADGYCICC